MECPDMPIRKTPMAAFAENAQDWQHEK